MKKIGWIFVCTIYFLIYARGFSNSAQGAVIISTSLSLSEEYNDNLFFTETKQEADFATILSPALSIGYTSKNVVLTLGYQGSAELHPENPEADGYFQSLSIGLDLPGLNQQIEGLEIRIIENMTLSPELPGFSFSGSDDEESSRRADRGPQNTGQGVQLQRTDTFQNQAGLSLSYDWTALFNTRLAYTNTVTLFSESEFEDRNVNQTTFDGTYRFPFSSRTSWTGTYGANLTTGDEEDQFIHSVSLGVIHQMSRLVSTDGEVGISIVKDESVEPTLSAGYSKRFQSGSLSVRYKNDVSAGLGVVESVTREESFTGSINRALGDRVSSFLQMGYSNNKSLSGNEVDSIALTASTGISVQLLKWLSGNLTYAYLKQDSDGAIGASGNVKRNTVTLFFTATGPSWRIIK